MALFGPSRADLRASVVTALIGANTLAGASVRDTRFWSSTTAQYPAINVSTPVESKQNLSQSIQGAPKFDTDVTVALSLRTKSPAPAGGQNSQAQADLETLVTQAEQCLLCGLGLLGLVQNIREVHTQFTVTAEGAPVLGEASILFVCTIRQRYDPDGAVPLVSIEVNPPDITSGSDLPLPVPIFEIPIAQS